MARYVRVSTIAVRPKCVDLGSGFQGAVEKVIEHLKSEVEQVLPDKPDLIVLPEACDCPRGVSFKEAKEYYKCRGDQVLEFFSSIARDNNCNIAYSAIREGNDGLWRNSTCIIDRSGKVIGTYSKNYPTILEVENLDISCEENAPIIECDFGRVACAICFDLNFDELRMKYAKLNPDIVIFSSMFHGGLLQSYWAYTCRCHFVGAISDGLTSSVISPVGQVIASSTNYYNFVTADINLDCRVVHLDFNMDRIRAAREKYKDKVKVTDPGYIGAVLISSETDEFTADDIIKEFGIEYLDDYFDRYLNFRQQRLSL